MALAAPEAPGSQVEHGKPNPDIFLEAARRLGVEPKRCLVFEDAENGVEAGHRAGMTVFAIPHADSRDHNFSKAEKVIGSFTEVTEDVLTSI